MKNSTSTPNQPFGQAECSLSSEGSKAPTATSTKPCTPQRRGYIKFTRADYELVLRAIVRAIGRGCYFNGTIRVVHPTFASTLTATLIIYRAKGEQGEPIIDIVPVWWELSTTPLAEGATCPDNGQSTATNDENNIATTLNDFSFNTLRQLILNRQRGGN